MKRYVFFGVLKNEMNDFVELRASQGLRDYTKLYILESLDSYLIAQNVSEKVITPNMIDNWLMLQKSTMHTNTINNFINYYAPFARYLNGLGFTAFIPEKSISEHTYVPHIFTEEELDTLFYTADEMDGRTNGSLSRVQFPILLRLLFGCGFRLGEVLRLRVNDFDAANGVIQVLNGKGNLDRLVPMKESLSDILSKYCSTLFKGRTDNPYLFEKQDRSHRTFAWAQWYFGKLLASTDIEKPKLQLHRRNICLHCFRHTFAVNSLRANEASGRDDYDLVPLLSVYLGHKHLTGTQVYLHMTSENAKDILAITGEFAGEMFPMVPSL